jgi:hypothetical protein
MAFYIFEVLTNFLFILDFFFVIDFQADGTPPLVDGRRHPEHFAVVADDHVRHERYLVVAVSAKFVISQF